MQFVEPDPDVLREVARYRMPFGKYRGHLLIELPEPYIVWFKRNGLPRGKLGELLALVYEIKVNGLEYLFDRLRGGPEPIGPSLPVQGDKTP